MTRPSHRLLPGDHMLADIVDEAYRVLDSEPPTDAQSCSCPVCCAEGTDSKDIITYPVDQIPARAIHVWLSAAVDDQISFDLWSWLLPRLFEGLAAGEELWFDIEVVLKRFPTANRSHWSDQQWRIINEFQKGFLDTTNPDQGPSLDAVLCMFAEGAWNVDELFQQPSRWSDDRLVEQLWSDWSCDSTPRIRVSAFWEVEDEDSILERWTTGQLSDRLRRYAAADSGHLVTKAADLVHLIDATIEQVQRGWTSPAECDQCDHAVSDHDISAPGPRSGGTMRCRVDGCDSCFHYWLDFLDRSPLR